MTSVEILSAPAGHALRAAERIVLGKVPDGTLMDRAAARLAVICADLLREAHGKTNGARVVLLVGTGNNGGDALLAGARLRHRGVQVDALLAGATAHTRGVDALSLDPPTRFVPCAVE